MYLIMDSNDASLTMNNGNAIIEEKSHVITIKMVAFRIFNLNHGDSRNMIAMKRSKLTTTSVQELKNTAVACKKLNIRQKNAPNIHL